MAWNSRASRRLAGLSATMTQALTDVARQPRSAAISAPSLTRREVVARR